MQIYERYDFQRTEPQYNTTETHWQASFPFNEEQCIDLMTLELLEEGQLRSFTGAFSKVCAIQFVCMRIQ